jgi:hypothetical protein
MMPEDETPEVVMVPVKRYDVNLTIDDILTPLADIKSRLDSSAAGADSPQLEPHLLRLSELASQLKEVVGQINRINPDVLTSLGKRRPSAD